MFPQVVCDQAINSLFNCLASPFILPGGGCLEASLILALLGQDKVGHFIVSQQP